MIGGIAVGLVLGALIGAAVVVALYRRRFDEVRAASDRTIDAARSQLKVLEERLAGEQRLAEERRAVWDEALGSLKGEFASLSQAALKDSNEQFLQLANAKLEQARQAARGDLDDRSRAIEGLLAPVRDQLGRYEEGLRQLEVERQRAYAGLFQQVTQLSESQERLQAETRNLVTALRAPATRGRWGEQQLRRVMELAGMLEHCDFEEQVTFASDEGNRRPDVVVHLPGGRGIVIDAKVPLQAYLDAIEAVDEESRKAHLVAHARQLRAHVDSLSKKAYWEQLDFTPEFVIAYIPGDELLTAALGTDRSLLDHAVESRVIPATPTTLIALLRTIAFGWRQEALAANALEVKKAGNALYKRLATFAEHFGKTGQSLGRAVEAYNKAVGSLERNVLPQARRLGDLGVGSPDHQLVEPDPLASVPRSFQAPELSGGDASSLEDPDEHVARLPGSSRSSADREAMREAGSAAGFEPIAEIEPIRSRMR